MDPMPPGPMAEQSRHPAGGWTVAPCMLLIADSDEGGVLLAGHAARAGGRIAATLPIERAIERLDQQISLDLLLLDVGCDHGALLDALLARVDRDVASGRYAAVVMVDSALLDIAASALASGQVALIVGRDEAELADAIRQGLVPTQLQLAEDIDDRPALRRQTAIPLDPVRTGAEPRATQGEHPAWPIAAADLRRIIHARRKRDEFFAAGLFADPAWDMLLDLTASRLEGETVTMSALCIAAAVPPTTALRWATLLADLGLIRRGADPRDGRRTLVELTDPAVDAMAGYFRTIGVSIGV
jgi:hypothetical protein